MCTLNVTESILGSSMASFEAQPCADAISAKSLHEASHTLANLQNGNSDNSASLIRTRNRVLSTYVSLLNAGVEIFRCFRHWSPYASTMLGPQNLFGDVGDVSPI